MAEKTIPIGPYYGYSSWNVGWLELGERNPDGTLRERPTGLAAFREARQRCLDHVRSIAGPGWPIRVDHIELVRETLYGRSAPVLRMRVYTITDHLPVRIVDTHGELA